MLFLLSAQAPPVEPNQEEVMDTLIINPHRNMVSAGTILQNNYITHENISPRKFGKNLQRKYKSPEFDYSATKPRESVWQRIKRKINKIFNSIFGNFDPKGINRYTELAIKVASVVIIGFLLYFVCRYIISKEGRLWLSKKNPELNLPADGLQKNIHEIDFAQKIADLENNSDYRSAVRYQFLWVLKKLSDSHKIRWDVQKTNQDYISELKGNPLRSEFNDLVRVFDYVWYGEINISQQNYNVYKHKFERFKLE